MTTSTDGIATPADHGDEPRVAFAARRLYQAELALHDAHQSYVEAWIVAASDKLHEAVVDYLAAAHGQEDASSRITRSRSLVLLCASSVVAAAGAGLVSSSPA